MDARMTKLASLIAATFALFALICAPAEARAQSSWQGVERIVVMGDMHADYPKFEAMLLDARLIDAHGNWAGGRTHFVQLGDVPDRGANSRAILDHLMRLEPQAQRAGGRVHALIGNHEAMNIEGDLRYVSAGEYASFADSGSARRRDAWYRQNQAALRANPPAGGVPTFDAAYRAQFDAQYPLGYVEHRLAWAPNGTYGRWIAGHNAIIRINDTLFMHAGLGGAFATADRDAMDDAVRASLRGHPVPAFADITTNENGPLWYRGLALNGEAAEQANLDAVLAHNGVARIVLGHTKRAATVLPRFNGRVVLTDIAVPDGYADPHAYLIIENATLTTVHRGTRVPLRASTTQERCAYLNQIAALDPAGSPTATLAARCSASGAATAAPEPVIGSAE
jgi:hypothetical protein